MTGIIFRRSIGYKQLLRVVPSEDDPKSQAKALSGHKTSPSSSDPRAANRAHPEGQPISTEFQSQAQYKVPRFVYRKDLLFPQLRSLQFQMSPKQGPAGEGLFQEVPSHRQEPGSPARSQKGSDQDAPIQRQRRGLGAVPAPDGSALLLSVH